MRYLKPNESQSVANRANEININGHGGYSIVAVRDEGDGMVTAILEASS